MKLTKEDIKILPEGQQIRNAVVERYGSIEEFISRNNLIISADTVKNYTRKKVVTSEKFRCSLAQIFDKDYHRIALSENDQIARYVDLVDEDIQEYNQEKDLEFLEMLRDMCMERKLVVSTAKMYRCIGMFNFYRGHSKVGIELLKLGTNMLEDRNEENLVISYLSETALIYFYEVKYEKANEIIDNINNRLQTSKNLSRKTMFLHYYRMGILYNNTARHSLARQVFQTALEYADDMVDIGSATMNIGITYKRQGQYYEAMKYYDKALNHYSNANVRNICVVLNNIAEIYKLKGDNEKALKYIEQSFNCLASSTALDKFISFYTYCEIKASQGDIDSTIDKLIALLSETEDKFLYKKLIGEGVAIIVKLVMEKGNKRMFRRLEGLIVNLIKETTRDDEEYNNYLKLCLGEIRFHTIEGGEIVEEKVI